MICSAIAAAPSGVAASTATGKPRSGGGGGGSLRARRGLPERHAIHLKGFSRALDAHCRAMVEPARRTRPRRIARGIQHAEQPGPPHEGLLVAEENGLLAHGDGSLAPADGDAADGRRRGRAQGRARFRGGIRALLERFLSRRQLHGEGQAGRDSRTSCS